jgi:hypothetical protein
MSTSIWGVDHGDEVSKAGKAPEKRAAHHLVAAGTIGSLSPLGAAAHGAYKGKPGRKVSAALTEGGASMAGATLGTVAGLKGGRTGAGIGGSMGGAVGAMYGARRNMKRGALGKPSSYGYVSKSVWGVDHGEDVSKASDKKYNQREVGTGILAGLTANTPIGGVVAGAQAKKGKRLRTGLHAEGRGFAEGMAGWAPGAALKSAPLAATGAAIGVAHGTMASMRNSRRKGWYDK